MLQNPTAIILLDLSTAVATLDIIILFPTLDVLILMSVATTPLFVDHILSAPIL